MSGRCPDDGGEQGTKRSVAGDRQGTPLHLVAARATTTTRRCSSTVPKTTVTPLALRGGLSFDNAQPSSCILFL